jgi:hypothetical protein
MKIPTRFEYYAEGGPHFGKEPIPFMDHNPKAISVEIEGRFETTFTEITAEQSVGMSLPASITWNNARIRFQETQLSYSIQDTPFDEYQNAILYSAELDYFPKKSGQLTTVSLSGSSLLDKPVLFCGSRNGFYALDPKAEGVDRPYYLVGVQPGPLEERLAKINAIWHELVHIYIYAQNYDLSLFKAGLTRKSRFLPPVAAAFQYGVNMAYAIEESGLSSDVRVSDRHDLALLRSRNTEIQKAYSLFTERNAWAGAGRLVMEYDLPTGFQLQSSFSEYARACLTTYAEGFHDSRFVNFHG